MISIHQMIDHGRNGTADRIAARRAPSFVEKINPVVRRMMEIGVPMGPNGLITVRGRKSGELRTTPVAFVEAGGQTWVQSPFGDVNWVRNLRAAGAATITFGRRMEEVRAVELSRSEKVGFFSEVLAPYIRRMRGGRLIARVLGLSEVLTDPVAAADLHPVFELRRETRAA